MMLTRIQRALVMVGAQGEISRHRAAGRSAVKPTLIPAQNIMVASNTPYMRYFCDVHPSVPVPPQLVPGGGNSRVATSLLDLWEQGYRRTAEEDAHGQKQAVARRAAGHQRPAPNGCHRHPRLLRPPQRNGWTNKIKVKNPDGKAWTKQASNWLRNSSIRTAIFNNTC
jgi:hypothetical protein